MSKKQLLARIDATAERDTTEYGIIESAVQETARGRWFLQEYARRNRHADTQTLLEAINKLYIRSQPAQTNIETDHLLLDIKDMANAIDNMRQGIKDINAGTEQDSRISEASCELDSIVSATEIATSRILDAAEHVQEAAWTMREQGIDEKACDNLDALATDIYTACSFQDITGQRTGKVIEVLQYLESRIDQIRGNTNARSQSCSKDKQNGTGKTIKVDAHLLNGPSSDTKSVSQSQIDAVLEDIDELDEPQLKLHTESKKTSSPVIPLAPEAQKPTPAPATTQPVKPIEDIQDEADDEDEEDENNITKSGQSATINMSSLDTDDMHALFCC